MDAILFDLDETLLDTSGLRDARAAQDWGYVGNNLHLVAHYESAAHEMPTQLQSQGVKVGVVTRSPRWYAEALLKDHGIPYDALVTGSDAYPYKPDPSALLAAAADLPVAAAKCAYVGDDIDDHHAAALGGMTSVGAIWSIHDGRAEVWHRYWPDLAFRDPAALLTPDEWPPRGLVVEAALAGFDPSIHWGSVVPYGDGISLGRYFDTKDSRAGGHALSAAIIDNKEAHKDSAAFVNGLTALLAKLQNRLGGALVTSVPKHGGEDFDRFAPHRATAAAELGGVDRPDLLSEKHEVEDYKFMGPEERAEANKDRFQAHGVPERAKVLVLDDVFTFGDTLRSCQTALLKGGAKVAYGMTMAHTQETLAETCPKCGRTLRVILGSRGRFIGCVGYWTADRCDYTRDV